MRSPDFGITIEATRALLMALDRHLARRQMQAHRLEVMRLQVHEHPSADDRHCRPED